MKHEKEWYTCDRCGITIKKPLSNIFKMPQNMVAKVSIVEYFPQAYIANLEKATARIGDMLCAESVEVGLYTDKKSVKYELCSKCRKGFERFMRNE